MSDPTEAARRARLAELQAEPGSREDLEARYGQVWNTEELRRDFDVIGFLAPFVVVRRKTYGVRGSMEFRPSPRLYYCFQADSERK
jgi:hypothetical protein